MAVVPLQPQLSSLKSPFHPLCCRPPVTDLCLLTSFASLLSLSALAFGIRFDIEVTRISLYVACTWVIFTVTQRQIKHFRIIVFTKLNDTTIVFNWENTIKYKSSALLQTQRRKMRSLLHDYAPEITKEIFCYACQKQTHPNFLVR